MVTTAHENAVAVTIMEQIGRPARWGLGAHDYRVSPDGLEFTARILPMLKDGTRGQMARNMRVQVNLNGLDLYEVTVTHRRGQTVTTHYASGDGAMGLDYRQLRAIMYALDSDQDHEPINWNRYHQVT